MSALIPFAQAAITVQGLLVSIGSLMTVNAMRALSQSQEKEWEIFLSAKEKGIPMVEPKLGRLEQSKKFLRIFWGINALLGIIGMMLNFGLIIMTSEITVGNLYLLVEFIWFLLLLQLLVFVGLSLEAFWALGIWLKKLP